MKDLTMLYIGTFGMVTMSTAIVLFVLWASSALKKQRQQLEVRDKHYLARIEVVENLVKNEFKIIIEHIKKITT